MSEGTTASVCTSISFSLSLHLLRSVLKGLDGRTLHELHGTVEVHISSPNVPLGPTGFLESLERLCQGQVGCRSKSIIALRQKPKAGIFCPKA